MRSLPILSVKFQKSGVKCYVKMEQNRSEPIKCQKNGRTGTKTSRKTEL